MTIILFFDTETTGLFPKSMENNELLPSIIQLSYILYDTDKKEIIDHFNEYIKQIKSYEATGDLVNAETRVANFIKILDEDRNSPYTDEKLKILFEKQHKILVSRKTISKYRTKLNISKSLDRKI